MLVVEIVISNGHDTDPFRDIAAGVVDTLNHLFAYEMGANFRFAVWDYRLDPPRLVPAGALPARSLAMVDRSEAVLAIFGATLPEITCKEVARSMEARRAGQPHDLWVFVDSEHPSAERSTFFHELRDEFGEEIQYTSFSSELDFQAKVFETLTLFALKRLDFHLVEAEFLA